MSASIDLRVAFLGTFPPRRCGIATFTRDLSEAVATASDRVVPITIALTDPGGQYEYSERVKYEIRQALKADYAHAAEFANHTGVSLVSVQHEYGIFGGDDGAYVLDFLTALRVPSLVTLHTVLKRPSASQKAIVRKMSNLCGGFVVMSHVAADLLSGAYHIPKHKVHIIPHGIPEMSPCDQEGLKARFGVSGRWMLLTFGLLSPNKGIEVAIRALPALIERFPDLVYFVVGATHPHVVRRHGESYRISLEREAEHLGVREHVVFRDQFITNNDLCNYLQAADVFVSPYQNEAQVTSGALAYAMGAGAAVVSTPYWHAQELLADGRGRLFPFGASDVLATTIASLLASPAELESVRSSAYAYTRSFVWPHIGRAYLELGTRLVQAAPKSRSRPGAPRAGALPELRLDHLLRMTDETGIIQHATFSVPARKTGYCVDDNARALIVALTADRLGSSPTTKRLLATYLSFLHHSQTDDGGFRNLMSYERSFEAERALDDCLGRAIWALGSSVQLMSDDGGRRLARQMLEQALPHTTELGPRGMAPCILGLANLLAAEPAADWARTALSTMAEKLIARYQEVATHDWHWIEPALTYDNAMIPLALFKAYSVTGERTNLRIARETLEFLERVCFERDRLALVGNSGWYCRGAEKSEADEQPIDAAAFVLAFRGAYVATGDHHYLRRMRQAFGWFLGANRLGLPLYDFLSGGCRDGLGVTQVNENQGAESTVCFLLSLIEMLELAGEEFEHPESFDKAPL